MPHVKVNPSISRLSMLHKVISVIVTLHAVRSALSVNMTSLHVLLSNYRDHHISCPTSRLILRYDIIWIIYKLVSVLLPAIGKNSIFQPGNIQLSMPASSVDLFKHFLSVLRRNKWSPWQQETEFQLRMRFCEFITYVAENTMQNWILFTVLKNFFYVGDNV